MKLKNLKITLKKITNKEQIEWFSLKIMVEIFKALSIISLNGISFMCGIKSCFSTRLKTLNPNLYFIFPVILTNLLFSVYTFFIAKINEISYQK